jgi:multicomponent Na+:H+ antiporter subunit D
MLLGAASAGVFLHAGIKFPWFVFFQRDSGLRPPEPPWNMRLAMLFVSALCIGLGVFYQPLYALLPYAVDYVPYTGFHVVAQLQLLLFSGLAFFVMLDWLRRTPTITPDVDWAYRGGLPRAIRRVETALVRAIADTGAVATRAGTWLAQRIRRLHGREGLFARTWASGSMALGMMAMLLALLLSYFVV